MKNKGLYVISIIVVFFVGVIGTLYTLKEMNLLTVNGGSVDSKTITEYTIKEEGSIQDAIEKVYDAVVYIETYQGSLSGSGSGFFYKTDDKYAYILTNNHVVEDATSVKITTTQEEGIEAEIMGTDPYTDTAVIRVLKEYAPQIATLVTDDNTELGDTIFTIGTPVGKTYMGTVTKGIISGVDRAVTMSTSYTVEVYQHDASINSGNSGGPLVNLAGEVIGINSMKLVQTSIEGMAFAIPIKLIYNNLEKLEKNEEIERPVLGVSMADVTNTYQLYRYNINLDSSITNGVVVVSVSEDSPANDAGIKEKDVITKFDGVAINDSSHFKSLLYKHNIGDTINLTVIRDGNEIVVPVLLDTKLVTD